MTGLRPLHDWTGPPAQLTLWLASAATQDAVSQARPSPIAPSYEQEQHLRAFRACEQSGEEMARLLIVVWEEAGRCDLRAMTHVVNAHLRRHDTYHSWFETRGEEIVRRVIADVSAIRMEPSTCGETKEEDWRRHVMQTPSPFVWDCFRFGVLQRASGFTFFASIDHLHADATLIAFLMREIRVAYRAVLDGEPPQAPTPGRYLDYCESQRRKTEAMRLEDCAPKAWVDFLHRNGGRMPAFVLPLGILEDRCIAEYIHADVLDERLMENFETACQAFGARAIGGLLACAAINERHLAGRARYSVVTPTTTRHSSQAFGTYGWCVGVAPIDFDIGECSFAELAQTAQRVFDERLGLAQMPIERIIELASGISTIRPAATGGVMLSYMDVDVPPLGPQIAREWEDAKGRVYINRGMAAQVALWFFRTRRGLSLTAAFPANDTARASMRCYVDGLTDACRRVACETAGVGASAVTT